jgi:glycosyltransferase involved in cell wall biosynthesis
MEPRNVLFIYWGRRGAIGRLTLDICRAALADRRVNPVVSVSRATESFDAFDAVTDHVRPIETFSTPFDALLAVPRLLKIRKSLRQVLKSDDIAVAINMMWHVWSPIAAPVFRELGVPYFVVVHDAYSHPGDRPRMAMDFMLRDIARADGIITLSSHVTEQLVTRGVVPRKAIIELFHPEVEYPLATSRHRLPGAKLRLLFFGRIMRYKGLPLFVEMVEKLRASNVEVEAGVVGEGDLGSARGRLEALGAEIHNRWITESEIAPLLARFDVVVASHVEASQSGVVAVSLGSGVPVVATPVGALPVQITDGVNGLIAVAATSDALAATVRRLAADPSLMQRLRAGAREMRPARTASAFLDALIVELDKRWPNPVGGLLNSTDS